MKRRPGETVVGVVELPAECDPTTARRIVTAAFRASTEGAIALLVDERARRTADAILDSLVRRLGTEVHGVLFLSPDRDLESVAGHVARGAFVVARSAALTAELRARGISFRPGDAGLADLEAAAQGGYTLTNARAAGGLSLAGAS